MDAGDRGETVQQRAIVRGDVGVRAAECLHEERARAGVREALDVRECERCDGVSSQLPVSSSLVPKKKTSE